MKAFKIFFRDYAGRGSLWRAPRDKTGIKITPLVLRDWLCVALGEVGIQDRYVDTFCGRIPKIILAKHQLISPRRAEEDILRAILEFGMGND